MSEYTYKDIIIDPTSEKARNYVGKEVYFSDNINICLYRANNEINSFMGVLQRITEGHCYPFRVNDGYYQVIIPIKEEQKHEPEYVPFESVDEFLDAYEDSTYSIACDSVENKLLSRGGIWLKYKATDAHLVVTEMWSNGLTVGNDIAVTRWNELLKYYEFLDGSPCGKIKE